MNVCVLMCVCCLSHVYATTLMIVEFDILIKRPLMHQQTVCVVPYRVELHSIRPSDTYFPGALPAPPHHTNRWLVFCCWDLVLCCCDWWLNIGSVELPPQKKVGRSVRRSVNGATSPHIGYNVVILVRSHQTDRGGQPIAASFPFLLHAYTHTHSYASIGNT